MTERTHDEALRSRSDAGEHRCGSTPAAVTSNRLPILADEIRTAHAMAIRRAHQSIEAGVRAGVALLEAKKLVGHGNWTDWVRANVPVTIRQVQRYMDDARLLQETAKRCEAENDAMSFLMLSALLCPDRSEPPSESERTAALAVGFAECTVSVALPHALLAVARNGLPEVVAILDIMLPGDGSCRYPTTARFVDEEGWFDRCQECGWLSCVPVEEVEHCRVLASMPREEVMAALVAGDEPDSGYLHGPPAWMVEIADELIRDLHWRVGGDRSLMCHGLKRVTAALAGTAMHALKDLSGH